jgi:hypothetical protein
MRLKQLVKLSGLRSSSKFNSISRSYKMAMAKYGVLLSTVLGFVCLGAVAQAQSVPAGCKNAPVPIIHLSGQFIPGGRVLSCPTSTTDISDGVNAPRPGEVLSISRGRFSQCHLYLLRGLPNTAYFAPAVHPTDVAAGFIADPAYYPVANLALNLPFQPYKIVSLGDLGDGHIWYGYTDLRSLPSHPADAQPLSRNSIIVAVDGFSFRTPNALLSLLSKPDGLGQSRRYVEVAYLEPGDTVPKLRRALIPLFVQSATGAEWSALAAGNHAFVSDNMRPAEAIVGIALMMTALTAFEQSRMGQEYLANQEACRREKTGTLAGLSC